MLFCTFNLKKTYREYTLGLSWWILTLTDNLIHNALPNRLKIDEVPEVILYLKPMLFVPEFRSIQEYCARKTSTKDSDMKHKTRCTVLTWTSKIFWAYSTNISITISRGGSRKFRRRRPSPLPPPPEWRLHFSGHATYSIVGVFVMQSKPTLTIRMIEWKSILQNYFQSKIVKHFESTRKKRGGGGVAPSAPALNPPLISAWGVVYQLIGRKG